MESELARPPISGKRSAAPWPETIAASSKTNAVGRGVLSRIARDDPNDDAVLVDHRGAVHAAGGGGSKSSHSPFFVQTFRHDLRFRTCTGAAAEWTPDHSDSSPRVGCCHICSGAGKSLVWSLLLGRPGLGPATRSKLRPRCEFSCRRCWQWRSRRLPPATSAPRCFRHQKQKNPVPVRNSFPDTSKTLIRTTGAAFSAALRNSVEGVGLGSAVASGTGDAGEADVAGDTAWTGGARHHLMVWATKRQRAEFRDAAGTTPWRGQ